MELLRLDKILSNTKEAGRRDIKTAIRAGRVTVDGVPVFSAKEKYDPARRIELDGVPVYYKKYRYLMLNKPAGYISATTDTKEKTVLGLLPENYAKMGLFPAGRLDKDAEGLLLITNDGDTAHALMSPRRHVEKLYFVHVAGVLDASDISAFEAGIVLDGDEACKPAGLEIIEAGAESTAYVTLSEGKFHQIKRMFHRLDKSVIYLKRLRIGPLTLDEELPLGGFRELTGDEELLITQRIMYEKTI